MTNSRSFRVKSTNAAAIVAAIRADGFDARIRAFDPIKDGPMDGGCSDPYHCYQHSGTIDDIPAVVIVTTVTSGNQFHRYVVAAIQ